MQTTVNNYMYLYVQARGLTTTTTLYLPLFFTNIYIQLKQNNLKRKARVLAT